MSSTPLFLALAETDFLKNCIWSFEWGTGAWVQMHRFNSFSNVNTKNWNFFATHGGLYKSEKIEQAFWKVIKPQGVEKKGCVSLRLILKNKGGKQHCFWKRGNIRKGVCWNRWLRLPFILFIRVSRKFYLHLCFKLRYYIQNGAKFLQKLTPGFKNHMRNLDNFTQAVESPELKFDGLLLSKKYIPSARTLHT